MNEAFIHSTAIGATCAVSDTTPSSTREEGDLTADHTSYSKKIYDAASLDPESFVHERELLE